MTASDPTAVVTGRGARRWRRGHPWIYRSDVRREPDPREPSVVRVEGEDGGALGRALYSPASEIRLRLLTRRDGDVDAGWWRDRIGEAAGRRADVDATAYRVVHAEGDGLPSLVVDRYGPYVVAELLSAGLEARREDVIAGLRAVLDPEGILLRNDSPVRRHEELPREVELAHGEVPERIEVREGEVGYLAAPWSGQKTGAYLDQRENRLLAGRLARRGTPAPRTDAAAVGSDEATGTEPADGSSAFRALDAFSYHGGFALHLAGEGCRVTAVDQSAEALARGEESARLNGLDGIEWVEANAFDFLRGRADAGDAFDLIVLDPPAFAKRKGAVEDALRGYKEINLRAMMLLAPGGRLLTFSCSYHVDRERFFGMLADAAGDVGRRLQVERVLRQAADHPELLTVPETGYLKGALLRRAG